MRGILLGVCLVLVGCGGDEFSDCAIGELMGTWRASYDETNGNCGAIADETVVFNPDGDPPAGCQFFTNDIAADRCTMTQDFECPIDGGNGSQRWVIVYEQVATGELLGDGTVTVEHDVLGSCRSTYDIVVRQL